MEVEVYRKTTMVQSERGHWDAELENATILKLHTTTEEVFIGVFYECKL